VVELQAVCLRRRSKYKPAAPIPRSNTLLGLGMAKVITFLEKITVKIQLVANKKSKFFSLGGAAALFA